MIGGEGSDNLNGGIGQHIVDYSDTTTGLRTDLAAGATDYLAGGAKDTLISIDSARGSQGSDEIYGNTDENWLSGDSGNDLIEGFGGSDIISGDDGNDELDGGSGNDKVYGGAGNDELRGGTNADLLSGGDDEDTLFGGAGADTLVGGRGYDEMFGQGGADEFAFGLDGESSGKEHSGGSLGIIQDFNKSQNDRVDLSGIDADIVNGADDAFVFIGSNSFSATAGELRYWQDQVNDQTIIEADWDGDGQADFMIELAGIHNLNDGDFIL